MKHLSLALSLLTALCLCTAASAQEIVEVTAVGQAAGNVANARELALTDALREAVRKGAGVDVVSMTKVSDFLLEYDRVFASSFGYVRGYSVLKSGLGDDEIYRVTVRAQVGKGEPDQKDTRVLGMILRLKQSPRVALHITESLDGVSGTSGGFAKAWFEQTARDIQINLVDLGYVESQQDKLAARDDLTGERRAAAWRRADLAQKADFIIEAKVSGKYVGRQSFYGSLPVHRFTLAADLRAIRPDSGVVLAAVTIPGRDTDSGLESADQAARDAMQKLLAGDPRAKSPGAMILFRKILANWIAELDLGVIMRLEFAQISDAEFVQLHKALSQTPKITSVWPREFDSRGLSFMDIETRLDPIGLKTAILGTLGKSFTLDRTTRNYLQFIRARAAEKPGFNLCQLPRCAWPLIAGGVLMIVALIMWLRRKWRP